MSSRIAGALSTRRSSTGRSTAGSLKASGRRSMKRFLYDETGQILTASLIDYALPRAGDVPTINTQHLEVESPTTVGGFRGMGEGGTIGAPAAIANALSDALAPLDVDIFELPVTPDRLFRLLENADSSRA